jgi:glyoxalase/bleomycin resistance protein/dioxygenase superfamily protein
MDLPDAPIAHQGFFATHFFTVRDQEKSKDFYVRILGGKVARNGVATCGIPTAISSRSGNILKWRSPFRKLS